MKLTFLGAAGEVTGSQHLYGPETLKQVDADSRQIVDALNAEAGLPIKLVGLGETAEDLIEFMLGDMRDSAAS
mgnify:CR=1 FL=1